MASSGRVPSGRAVCTSGLRMQATGTKRIGRSCASAPGNSRVGRRGDAQVVRIGNFGGGGQNNNWMEQMKQAQQAVQTEAQKAQQELANSNFEGYDTDELVQVIFNGNQQPVSTSLTDDAMSLSADQLSAHIDEAMQDAHKQSVDAMRSRMSELAGSLGLPGADGGGSQ